MKKKKLLTLEDLVKFCKEQQFYSFSSKESGYQLCVMVPATFEKEDVEESSLLFAKVKAFHTGRNRNQSNVTVDAAQKSLSTFAYKPILAAFHTNEETGEEDFMSHEMEMDDDGNIVYIEHQVGSFTADEPYMESDPESERQYVYATAAIPREYTHAADIIERKGGTKVSVELIVNKFSYDSDKDELLLEDIEVSGLTLLGTDEDWDPVEEGMQGARLDIADFSKQKNSAFSYEELTTVIKETVMQALADINNSKEGGQKTMKYSEEKLNELLEKFGAKSEDLTFDLEAIESDEALENAFEAQFSNDPSDDKNQPTPEEKQIEMSVKLGEETKTFAKSLSDVIYALTDLVNATYADDGTWYAVDVFDQGTAKSRYVIMQDMWSGKAYKQAFTIKDGVYSLKNDREEVFAEWVTASEREQLDSIRSNYAAMSAELSQVKETLAKHEAEPDKIAVLESDDYSKVAEAEEFVELKKKENHFDLTVDEVREKADQILLNAAKAGKVEFAKVEEQNNVPKVTSKPLMPFSNTKKRYGSLFENI